MKHKHKHWVSRRDKRVKARRSKTFLEFMRRTGPIDVSPKSFCGVPLVHERLASAENYGWNKAFTPGFIVL